MFCHGAVAERVPEALGLVSVVEAIPAPRLEILLVHGGRSMNQRSHDRNPVRVAFCLLSFFWRAASHVVSDGCDPMEVFFKRELDERSHPPGTGQHSLGSPLRDIPLYGASRNAIMPVQHLD